MRVSACVRECVCERACTCERECVSVHLDGLKAENTFHCWLYFV